MKLFIFFGFYVDINVDCFEFRVCIVILKLLNLMVDDSIVYFWFLVDGYRGDVG